MTTKKAFIIPAAIFAFLLIFYLGFNQGLKHGASLESAAFAAISTGQIKRLRSGTPEEIEEVISLLDWYIDTGTDNFIWYLESGNEYLGNLITDDYEKSMIKSMRIIAAYRRDNPEKDISSLFEGEAKEEYLDRYIYRKSTIEAMSEN